MTAEQLMTPRDKLIVRVCNSKLDTIKPEEAYQTMINTKNRKNYR